MEFESNDTDLDFEPSDYSDIFLYTDILMVALSLIGIAGNILIISTILSSKSLQTRTYLLLMNWSIFNILYRIFAESLLYLLPINLNLKAEMICLTINLNSIFQLAEIVFLLALISNWAVKSVRMNNLLVIFIFYALIVLVLIVMMGLCMFNVFTRIVETSAGIAYLCLLITVIAKTVNRVYKARVDPLSEDTARRLNLASIYTLWFFCLIAIIIPLGFYKQFIYMDYVVKSTNLIPFAFIAYLIRVDHVFKSTFIDLMKCRRPQQRPIENIAYDVHNNEGVVYSSASCSDCFLQNALKIICLTGECFQVIMEPVHNERSLETDTEFGELHRYTEMMGTALSLIAIVANIVIITTVLSSKRLQTRAYLLLLNWSIFNILFRLTSDNLLHVMLMDMEHDVEMICVTMNMDTMFRFAEMVFLLALTSSWVLRSYRLSDLVILLIFYAIIASSLLVVITLCALDIETELVHALGGATFLLLLIVVLFKNANRVCKAKRDPLSSETVKRLNLANIYTFWMLASMLLIVAAYVSGIFILIQLSTISTFLIPLIFILYLSRVDEVFKDSFLALIYCRRLPHAPIENDSECCNNP